MAGSRHLICLTLATLCAGAALFPASAAASGSQSAGVQAHLLWSSVDSQEMDRQIDMAKRAGAGLIRVDLGWASLEQAGKGAFSSWYVSKIDAVVDKARSRGVEVLFTVMWTPCWASSAPADIKQNCEGEWWKREVQAYPPSDPSDYADALAWLVRRYGDRVFAWEVWNEPNLDSFWKTSSKALRYSELLKAAYPAAKAVSPTSTIVAGALAESDYEFTDTLFSLGIKGYFDAFSIHPYSGDHSPLNPEPDKYIKNSFVRGIPAVRDVQTKHGDSSPLWLTEFGWSTCTVRDGAPYENCVDPDVQADYLQLAYRQMQEFDYVPVGVWFNLKDTSTDLGDLVGNYGLTTYSGQEKLAYAAFQESALALAADAPVPAPETTSESDSTSSESDSGKTNGRGSKPTKKPRAGGRLARVAQLRYASGLRAIRYRGRILLKGRMPEPGTLRIRGYRWRRGASKFAQRPAFRGSTRVAASGRFSRALFAPRLLRGRWRITVVSNRFPRVRKSVVLPNRNTLVVRRSSLDISRAVPATG